MKHPPREVIAAALCAAVAAGAGGYLLQRDEGPAAGDGRQAQQAATSSGATAAVRPTFVSPQAAERVGSRGPRAAELLCERPEALEDRAMRAEALGAAAPLADALGAAPARAEGPGRIAGPRRLDTAALIGDDPPSSFGARKTTRGKPGGSPRPGKRANDLTIASGDGQSGEVGAALPMPLVVAVRDSAGNPLAGVDVLFEAGRGNGSVATAQALTDAQGLASTLYTLGSRAGTQTVNVRLNARPTDMVRFALTAVARAAKTLEVVSGDNQSGAVGSKLPQPLVARVVDGNGNPVMGATVGFRVSAGGGAIDPPTAVSDASGQVRATLTLGPAPATNNVVAELAGSAPLTFTATGVAVPATSIEAASGDMQVGTAGAALGQPLVVRVKDAQGQPVSGYMVQFAVAAGGGRLSASAVATDAKGLAAATLTLGALAGTNAVTANAQGLTGSPVTFTAVGNPGPAAAIAAVSGDKQSGEVGKPLAQPFVVAVRDALGNPVGGFKLTFAVAAGGGALSVADATTDAKGQARTLLTLGAAPATNTVTANAAGLAGAPVTFTAAGVAAAAGGLTKRSGDAQSAPAATALAKPLVVAVKDAKGQPVAGFQVAFAVTAGGGSLSVQTATTNAVGEASTVLTVGTKVGPNTVTATAAGLTGSPLSFSATTLPGPAATIAATSGDKQSGPVGQPLAAPFVVTALDAYQNPVPNVTVSFAVAAGGGSLSASAVTTDAKGEARSTLTLGATAGTNTVTATSGNLGGSPLTFTAMGIAATPTTLSAVSGDKQKGTVGAALAAPLVVQVADKDNQPVANVAVDFRVMAGGGAVSAAKVVTGANGQASTTLTLGKTAGPNTVTATTAGLANVVVTFSATGEAGPAAALAIASGDKQSGVVGAKLANPLVVAVQDADGNPVAGASVAFAVTAGGGTLSAASATTDANGQASAELTLGKTVAANTVTATVSGLTPVSFSAQAMAATASTISLTSGNNQTGTAGAALANPLVVTVQDMGGNPVAGFNVSFAVATGGGTLSAATAATDANGRASSTLTLGKTAGTQTVTANATGLAGSPVAFSATAVSGGAATLTAASGDNQTGFVGEALQAPLVVVASDANGNPVANVAVSFAVATGGGQVSSASVRTDMAGRAQTAWTLGGNLGPQTLTATATGLPALTFTATGQPLTYVDHVEPILRAKCIVCHGPGGVLAVRPLTNYQEVRTSVSLAGALPYVVPNDPDNSYLVQKTGPGGSMAVHVTTAQAATIRTWVATGALNDAAGGVVATQLTKTSGDTQSGATGAPLAAPLVVTALDAANKPVAGVTVTWAVTAGGGMLSSASGTTDATGRAQVSWTLGAAGTNTATATIAGAPAATFSATGVAASAYSGEPLASSTHPLDVAALAALKADGVEPVALASDAEFLRRVTADLLGRIPTEAEARAFLADASATKREAAVDRLLASDEFGKHWAKDLLAPWLGVPANQRFDSNGDGTTDDHFFDAPVSQMLQSDTPLTQLVTDLATASGQHGQNFERQYRDRGRTRMADPLVEVFAGMSLSCARCHDHPLTTPLDDPRWIQDQSYGVYAFFANGSNDARKIDKEGRRFGNPVEPLLVIDGATNPPAAGVTLADSLAARRAKFAQLFTTSQAFARGTAHRIWGVMAQPLLDPNEFTQANLAAVKSPQVLAALTQGFTDSQFALKAYLRWLTRSRLYQLTSAAADTKADAYAGRALLRRHESETIYRGVHLVAGVSQSTGTEDGVVFLRQSTTFSDVFGFPRTRAYITERRNDVNMAQALLQLNSTTSTQGKVTQSGSRIRDLAGMVDGGQLTFDEAVHTIVRAALSRNATAAELQACRSARQAAGSTREALEDVAVALCASTEFNFR